MVFLTVELVVLLVDYIALLIFLGWGEDGRVAYDLSAGGVNEDPVSRYEIADAVTGIYIGLTLSLIQIVIGLGEEILEDKCRPCYRSPCGETSCFLAGWMRRRRRFQTELRLRKDPR